jgi:hydroxyacyl-ACP dehydratase HTD2-like protein with hotdog domain
MSDSPPNDHFRVEHRDVTRSDISRFANAIGATDDIHHNISAARDVGYPDVVAPLSFFMSMGLSVGRHLPRALLGRDGLNLDDELAKRRVLAGETEVSWYGDIYAGDRVTVEQRLVEVSKKTGRSGHLGVYVYERKYSVNGSLKVLEKFSRIARDDE